MSKNITTVERIIYGVKCLVTVCAPSRRKAASSIQRKRRKSSRNKGTNFIAVEKGTKGVKIDD